MSKLTAQDYIDATSPLARVGFKCIKDKLVTDPVGETAELYDVDEKVIELVKTTGSATEFETIIRLERERAEAEAKVEVLQAEKAEPPASKPKPKTWHYVVATLIIVAIVWLITVGLIKLIGILGEVV